MIFGLGFPFYLGKPCLHTVSAGILQMSLGSSLSLTSRVGGLLLLLFSPLLSLSGEQTLLLGLAFLQLPARVLPSLGQDHDFMAPGESMIRPRLSVSSVRRLV